MQPTLPNSASVDYAVCPYLGVSDDSGTALNYPSACNYCYHANPVAAIRRPYQTKYCLGGEFQKCLVFKTSGNQPLPNEIGEPRMGEKRSSFRVWLISALIVLLAIATLVVWKNSSKIFSSPPREQEINVLVLQTITQIFVQTQLEDGQTSEPTLTQTPSPSPTILSASPNPTPFAPHQLEVPFGTNPMFVIHRVQTGESYIRFMEEFNTTKEAIVAVNYGNEPVLWADSLLIIPIDVSDATGLPAFSAFQVTDLNLTVEILADNQGLDLDLLERYNSLPDGYIFSEGEWVLIPH